MKKNEIKVGKESKKSNEMENKFGIRTIYIVRNKVGNMGGKQVQDLVEMKGGNKDGK